MFLDSGSLKKFPTHQIIDKAVKIKPVLPRKSPFSGFSMYVKATLAAIKNVAWTVVANAMVLLFNLLRKFHH